MIFLFEPMLSLWSTPTDLVWFLSFSMAMIQSFGPCRKTSSAIHFRTVEVLEIEFVPAGKIPAPVRSADGRNLRLFLLNADIGQPVTLIQGGEFSRIIVDFPFTGSQRLVGGHLGFQDRFGRIEVVIVDRIFGDPDFLRHLQLGDDIFEFISGTVNLAPRHRLMGAEFIFTGGIGDNQGVNFLFMPEIIENALLLHQPGYKIEIRFAILSTVLFFLIGTAEFNLVIRKFLIAENLLDDILDGLVLKNS